VTRRAVAKTYKLYVGGAFVRSESGRHLATESGPNVPLGSRKDVRDAVRAARKAFGGWSARTAYNRGQVLYRFAEALESRADLGAPGAVDDLVHFAGWTDKLAAVLGGLNPVAGPFLSFTLPEPTGVVAIVGAESLDAVVREAAPALAAGNTVVALTGASLDALDLGEVAGVSDVPGGVLNLVSGEREELVEPLCAHRDVNAIVDLTGDPRIDGWAAETVKRVSRPSEGWGSLSRLERLVELKTAWHPVGA
jgi:acyl-CoA reductase-like NAD-dependent aldehyde dehydrogenase